jgi:hypothetical protein
VFPWVDIVAPPLRLADLPRVAQQVTARYSGSTRVTA